MMWEPGQGPGHPRDGKTPMQNAVFCGRHNWGYGTAMAQYFTSESRIHRIPGQKPTSVATEKSYFTLSCILGHTQTMIKNMDIYIYIYRWMDGWIDRYI